MYKLVSTRIFLATLIFILPFWLASCSGPSEQQKTEWKSPFRTPFFFPQITFPAENTPNQARWELGKKLFYDARLSRDEKTSCSTCHKLSMAFTDGQPVAINGNFKKGKRNSPTLFNVAWQGRLMSEGGVMDLERQVLAPLLDSMEMHASTLSLNTSLVQDEGLRELAHMAYGRELDFYVISRALAVFERSLISHDSKFDHYYYYRDQDFAEEEKKGWELFKSAKFACIECHALPFFRDSLYHDIGMEETDDYGLERRTYRSIDRYKFKTPSLRNVELTAPYMHDGRYATLEEVLNHHGQNPEQVRSQTDLRLKHLPMTETEKRALLAFLRTLTDWNAVQRADLLPITP